MITSNNSPIKFKNILTHISIIFLFTIPFTPVKSQALNNNTYFEYVAKQAKLLNDFNFTTDIEARQYEFIDFSEEVFSKEFLSKENITQKNIATSGYECDITDYKFINYYYLFNPSCNSRQRLAHHADNVSKVIAKFDNYGYDSYIDNSLMPWGQCHFLEEKYFDSYLTLLMRYKKYNLSTDARDNNLECKNNFYKRFPNFIPIGSRCDVSDWFIYLEQLEYNPHCSIVDIASVPRTLNYYFTSWGIYKIGEVPNKLADKRFILKTTADLNAETYRSKEENDIINQKQRSKYLEAFKPNSPEEQTKISTEQERLLAASPGFLNRAKFYWNRYNLLIVVVISPFIGLYFIGIKYIIRRLKK